MTIPETITFPLRADFEEFEDVDRYQRDLIFQLQGMYEQLAQGINGTIRSDTALQRSNWTPKLDGTAVSGTFTYTHQIGWVLRQGNLTDIWFDVLWTNAGAATGNLFLELPYKVANSSQKPFNGSLQTATIAYGVGQSLLHINATPSTYRGEIWSSGSGTATANVPVAAAGQLIGHVRYLGEANEA